MKVAIVSALALAWVPAAFGQTAFRALFVAGKSAPGASLVEVSGENGAPQPAKWTFLYADPQARGGAREVVVAGNTTESVRTPLRGFAGISERLSIPLARLTVDSDRAFRIANTEAIRSRVGFDAASYRLTAAASGEPVWEITLKDRSGQSAGVVRISAESGRVLGGLSAAASTPVPGPSPEPIGGIIGDVRDLGVAIGLGVRDTTLRTVGTVQEFLTGRRTVGPPGED